MKTEARPRMQKQQMSGVRADDMSARAGASTKIGDELRTELRAIFKDASRGFSHTVDNFIQAEVGHTHVEGKGYQKSPLPLREKAALAASLLREMKSAFPDAFRTAPHSGDPQLIPAEGERLYLQSMLEQLESVAASGELFVKIGEPTQAKRARITLPQLLEHADELPVRR